jgi:ABC-2 type transport system permease protein
MSDLAVRDSVILSARSTRLSWRNLDALVTAVLLPVVILVLFVYLFGGAIDTGASYVDYVAPSVILLCACIGASSTAVSVSLDLTGGIVDRFRAMDVPGVALLGGHVVASVARNAISTLLVFAVAYLIGFRPNANPLAWLGVVGMLGLFVLAVSWLAAALGLLVKSPEAASGIAVFLMFLPYPSSAFVPIDTMPSWLQGFAEHQPATPVIETLRGLLLGTPIGSSAWLAIAWCVAILVASMLLAGVLFRRRTR